MDHLSPRQIEELRRRLLEERDRILQRESEPEVDPDKLGPEPGDREDMASEEQLRTNQLTRSRHDRARLEDIEAALHRISDGTYGICEETGEAIPYARLLAQPAARYTVEAQELLEREHAQARTAAGSDFEGY